MTSDSELLSYLYKLQYDTIQLNNIDLRRRNSLPWGLRVEVNRLIRLHTLSRQLQSNGSNRLQERVKLAFTERAFCYAARSVLNSLPQFITSNISYFTSFKRLLLTEYFNHAYRQWHEFFTRTCDFKIVNNFDVRHQLCYDYDYSPLVSMQRQITLFSRRREL